MNRPGKNLLIGLAGLSVAAIGAIALISLASHIKAHRIIAVNIPAFVYKEGAPAVAGGKYLFESRGCADCHGIDGAGHVFIDDASGFYVKAPNITVAPGSATEKYTERDWVSSIRHGIKPTGRPLLIMPSEDYNRLTDGDLADLVAYVRQLPPKAGGAVEIRLPLLVKAIYVFGLLKDAAEKIDHARPPSAPVPVADSVEHGAYVANACIGCHGPRLAGGKIPGAPPAWPAAANLTAAVDGAMQRYPTAQEFTRMMRTGERPDGSKVSRYMPFDSLRHMNDVDLQALYKFLKPLAPVPTGTR